MSFLVARLISIILIELSLLTTDKLEVRGQKNPNSIERIGAFNLLLFLIEQPEWVVLLSLFHRHISCGTRFQRSTFHPLQDFRYLSHPIQEGTYSF